jgi:exosortase/archaeosortase family protein
MRGAIVEHGSTTMSIAIPLPCRAVAFGAGSALALHALALWPHGLWAARRMADGSDDPLGAAAAIALLVWLWREREALRPTPRLMWLGIAALLALAATAAVFVAPPLAAALLAVLSLAAHAFAWLPERAPRVALAGLALLALPLVASLQFYVGYPLRVFTAQFSAWLLQALGIEAERSGAAMTVTGQLVVVDAPCSGVQMAWLAYFAACGAAAFARRREATASAYGRDGAFVRRLPLVGVTVLGANVLRNTLLVALEARPQGIAPWLHESIGLAALAAVVVITLRLVVPQRAGAQA